MRVFMGGISRMKPCCNLILWMLVNYISMRLALPNAELCEPDSPLFYQRSPFDDHFVRQLEDEY